MKPRQKIEITNSDLIEAVCKMNNTDMVSIALDNRSIARDLIQRSIQQNEAFRKSFVAEIEAVLESKLIKSKKA